MYGKTVQGVIRSTFVVDEKGKIEVAQYNVKRHRPRRQAATRPVGLSSQVRASSSASAVAARSSTPEVQALVDAVRLRARVFHAGDQDLGRRETPRRTRR